MALSAVRGLGWSGAVVAIALGLLVIAKVVPLETSWRAVAAVAFVLLAPGASLAPLLGLRDARMELALVVPLSIATLILTAVALFYTNTWTPARELAVLVGICAVASGGRVTAHILGRPRTGREGSPTANGGTVGPRSRWMEGSM